MIVSYSISCSADLISFVVMIIVFGIGSVVIVKIADADQGDPLASCSACGGTAACFVRGGGCRGEADFAGARPGRGGGSEDDAVALALCL